MKIKPYTPFLAEHLEARRLLNGTISGIAFFDTNQNELKEAGEGPILGAHLALVSIANASRIEGDATSSSGAFSFANVPAGQYQIVPSAVDNGWERSTNLSPLLVTVTDNVSTTGVLVPVVRSDAPPVYSITINTFDDLNGNGIKDAREDNNDASTYLYLDQNNDGVFSLGEAMPVSLGDGGYAHRFLLGAPGTYRLQLPYRRGSSEYRLPDSIFQTGYLVTLGTSGRVATIDLPTVTTDAPIAGTASISGHFFYDQNGNGIEDDAAFTIPPASQLAGAQISGPSTVYLDVNRNGIIDPSEPGAPLDATFHGNFQFKNLAAGTYDLLLDTPYATNPAHGLPLSVTVADGEQKTGIVMSVGGGWQIGQRVEGRVYSDDDLDGQYVGDRDRPLARQTVYADLNNNGVLDAAEPYYVTSRSGQYSLENLPIGSVVIRTVAATGWHATTPNAQTATLAAHDVQQVDFVESDRAANIGAVVGFQYVDMDRDGKFDRNGDVTYYQGHAYLDLNKNGAFDSGEPDAAIYAGKYAISNVPNGTYVLRIIAPFTDVPLASSLTVTVAGGQTITAPDFVYYSATPPTAQNYLSVSAYFDTNRDGIDDDNGYNGAFVSGYVDLNNDGVWEPSAEPGTTDQPLLTQLTPGQYTVRVVPAANQFVEGPSSYTVTVLANDPTLLKIPVLDLHNQIYGRVFADLNGDGVQEAFEPGLPYVHVYDDLDHNGVFTQPAPDASGRLAGGDYGFYTDGAGQYLFDHYDVASADIRIELPAGYQQSYPFNGASYVLNFTDGTTHTFLARSASAGRALFSLAAPSGKVFGNENFAIVPAISPPIDPKTGSIAGITFNDTNGNGTLDAGESLGSGKTIYLDTNNDGVLESGEKSFTTGSNGAWSFIGLGAGTYHVRRVFPGGYTYSTPLIDATLTTGQAVAGLTVGSKSTTAPPPVTPPVTPPVPPVLPPPSIDPSAASLEAEAALLGGNAAIATKHAGYTGSGYVGGSTAGSSLQWSVARAAAAVVTATFRYSNGDSIGRSFSVIVNGVVTAAVAGVPNGSWDKWSTVSIDLSLLAGANTITLSSAGLAVNLDNVVLTTKSGPTPPSDPMNASISGTSFDDSNKNGALDASETKTSGKTVFLDANNNGKLDSGEKSVVSGTNGAFSFTGLSAGSYHVRRVFPSGYTYSTTLIDLSVAPGQTVAGLVIGSKSY